MTFLRKNHFFCKNIKRTRNRVLWFFCFDFFWEKVNLRFVRRRVTDDFHVRAVKSGVVVKVEKFGYDGLLFAG